MITPDILRQKLTAIDQKDYGAYQALKGSYDFGFFSLVVRQVPKDPYAPPHTGVYCIRIRRDGPQTVRFNIENKTQKIAVCDYLARTFFSASRSTSEVPRGTGFSGMITINEPGQAILERNSVVITDEVIEVRCFLGLPAEGRKICADIAIKMLCEELPEIVRRSLLHDNSDYDALFREINAVEDAEFLRSQLDRLGMVSFIADNAILPRESGTSDRPLADGARAFESPGSLKVEIALPHTGTVTGMGVPKGVTLISGGGYHGKSTLLHVIETGIYNHVPGDGRELCVTDGSAVKVRAYSGRPVTKSDISAFIRNLPFKKDTISFTTVNASGSTSQAATIVEAIECGASVLLMDEDTCATNFMIRDRKMQQLVAKADEPITTFIDRVRGLYDEEGVSTVLVLGGVGDYFDVADTVIQMVNYVPRDVTQRAKEISASAPLRRETEDEARPFAFTTRCPLARSVDPKNEYGKFRVYSTDIQRLNFGKEIIDLTDLEQLTELSQTKALGYALVYAKKYMDGKMSLCDVARRVINDINDQGMDVLSDRISGHFAIFRWLELAFVFNRMRGADLEPQKKDI